MAAIVNRLSSSPMRSPNADRDAPVRHSTIDEIEAVLPGAKRIAEGGEFGRNELDHQRGTVEIMADHLTRHGESPERAREISVAAARRHDGESVDYKPRS